MSKKSSKRNRAVPRRSNRRAVGGKAKAATSLLLRDIPADVLEVLRARAARAGHSLQQELHESLRRDAQRNFAEAAGVAAAWRARLAGRKLPDTLGLIRADRER